LTTDTERVGAPGCQKADNVVTSLRDDEFLDIHRVFDRPRELRPDMVRVVDSDRDSPLE
jgi:hypothetical protein